MNCRYCQSKCVKNGRQANGTQRYICKHCGKTQQNVYKYAAKDLVIRSLFLKCLKIGSSLRGIQCVTGIAVSTQLRWIRRLGKAVKPPSQIRFNDEYELDELCTYVGNKDKRRWVISAISKTTKQIIDIQVGTRTKRNLKLVVDKLLSLSPSAIYTDKLPHYRHLIPKALHKVKRRRINTIERHHLNLRTHIKRLNRRTICFSRKADVLSALVRIYCWVRLPETANVSQYFR